MSKPFLTIREQIDRLSEKHISCETTDEKKMLIKKGYFNLINGYKMPFISHKLPNGNHVYHDGTSVKKIGQVFKFDRRLSNILLKNLTHVEEEIRNVTAYFFDLYNKNSNESWCNVSCYDERSDEKTILKLIDEIKNEIKAAQKSNNAYIKHYANKDFEIPTWVMIKVLKMTTFTKFLELSNKKVKIAICELYDIEHNATNNEFKILLSALNWIRKTRNACAHNERIIFIQDDNYSVITKYHTILSNAYKKRTRKKQLIDLLIFLKYFNTKKDYNKLINLISIELQQMKQVIGDVVYEKIRVGLGIRNVDHLQVISSKAKTIDYTKLLLLT